MSKEALYGEEDRLLKTSEVTKIVGLTRTTIYNMLQSNQFPDPDWVNESGYRFWWKSTIYAHFNKKQALAS